MTVLQYDGNIYPFVDIRVCPNNLGTVCNFFDTVIPTFGSLTGINRRGEGKGRNTFPAELIKILQIIAFKGSLKELCSFLQITLIFKYNSGQFELPHT